MDIFQLIGDMLHLIACLLLILKIMATRNVTGICNVLYRAFL